MYEYLWCSIPEALSKSLHSNRVTFSTTSKEVGAESAKSCVLPPAVILSRQVPTEPRNDILYNTDMTERDGWEVRSLHKRHAVAMNIWVDKCMPLFFYFRHKHCCTGTRTQHLYQANVPLQSDPIRKKSQPQGIRAQVWLVTWLVWNDIHCLQANLQ